MTLSGASLKVELGGLGLPPSWFGDRVGVTMRTVVRWFDSDVVAPEVSQALEDLREATLVEMKKIVSEVDDEGDVTLTTYRTDKEFKSTWPAEWHRALVFRVADHFRAQGRVVHVEYR